MLHREISHKRFQIDALDGLRGFAALLVVLSHTSNEGMHLIPFLDFRGTGKSGVFLFFLLSSFLLGLPLSARETRLFTAPVMANYWTRRVLRIYPLYTLYLLAALVSSWLMGRLLDMQGVGVPFYLRVDELFKHLALIQGKGVTWSIAVEFKFYFILPLLVLGFQWARRSGLPAASLALLLSLGVCHWVWPPSETEHNDIRLGPYLSIFLCGIYLAIIQEYIQNDGPHAVRIIRSIRWLSAPAIIGLLFMTPSVQDLLTGHEVSHRRFHHQFLPFAACWSVVLMAAIHSGGGWIAACFNFRPLRSLGALSFSLYLFHMPLVSAMKRVDWPGMLEGWIVLLVSLGASWLSFRLIEEPISRIRVKEDLESGRLRFIIS